MPAPVSGPRAATSVSHQGGVCVRIHLPVPGIRRGADPIRRGYFGLGRGPIATYGRNLQCPTRSIHRARSTFLRLAATSDGAASTWQDQAVELEPSDDISLGEAIAAIVIAHRTGGDPAPYEAVVREQLEDDAETLLAFGDAERLSTELDALEAKRIMLLPEWRGHAAVLGLGTLADDAPAHWRGDARRFLFAGERPYLAPPAEG